MLGCRYAISNGKRRSGAKQPAAKGRGETNGILFLSCELVNLGTAPRLSGVLGIVQFFGICTGNGCRVVAPRELGDDAVNAEKPAARPYAAQAIPAQQISGSV